MRRAIAGLLVLATTALACRARETSPAPAETAAPVSSVTVKVAPVASVKLESVVDARGHTAALVEQRVRAPFAGTLVALSVADGDPVKRGDVLGTILSRDSEAALSGAREMEREARTSAEQSDAERAVALAERNLIRVAIRAPSDGVILSHTAAAGDRMAEDQEILTLADTASLVFVADLPQSELSGIRPHQSATIDLAGRGSPLRGLVHGVMPTANAVDFTAAVRIDFVGGEMPVAVGLFGTAHIVVAEKLGALVVPESAILRDDVTGRARVALLRQGHAHWEDVVLGIRGRAGVEILSPAVRPGDVVIVEGLVGLPEGAAIETHS